MTAVFTSPSRYIQGKGELSNLGAHASRLGSNALCLISAGGLARSGRTIERGFAKAGINLEFEIFGGECSRKEIDRVSEKARQKNKDLIIGVGGGKVIDTAKAAAFALSAPVIVCPTVAASDAPCSAVSVVYSEEGVMVDAIFMPSNPDIVLVDTEVIAKSPLRTLAAGMGDAMATWFEVRACVESGSDSCVGGKVGLLAQGIARLCYETLLAEGEQACQDIRQGVCSDSVEKIIEANTLLSGLGFESGGLSCAHAVHSGLMVLPETHQMFHGEKVNFGTIVQLVIEQRDEEELRAVLAWMKRVGLPVTLGQLGITDKSREHLLPAAEAACADMMMDHMCIKVIPDMVVQAMIRADALGQG